MTSTQPQQNTQASSELFPNAAEEANRVEHFQELFQRAIENCPSISPVIVPPYSTVVVSKFNVNGTSCRVCKRQDICPLNVLVDENGPDINRENKYDFRQCVISLYSKLVPILNRF